MPAAENQLSLFETTSALENLSLALRKSRAHFCEVLGDIEVLGGNSKQKRIAREMIISASNEVEKHLRIHFGFAGK